MLVVCPECGAEISQYSETCVKCGFPLKKFMDDNGLNDFEHVKICPKCGCTNSRAYPQDGVPIRLKCKKCGTNLVQTDIPCEGFGKNFTLETEREYMAEIANKYGGNQFQQEMYDEWVAKLHAPSQRPASKPQPNQPHCPYCNSTNLTKVSGTSRFASTLMFGIGSKKVGKQWKCNNCKSYF